MPDYKVPVNDYLFLFNDVLDMQSKYKDVQGGGEATTIWLRRSLLKQPSFVKTNWRRSIRVATLAVLGMMVW